MVATVNGWLPRKDSNLDKEIQNLSCYRYTTRQSRTEDVRRSGRFRKWQLAHASSAPKETRRVKSARRCQPDLGAFTGGLDFHRLSALHHEQPRALQHLVDFVVVVIWIVVEKNQASHVSVECE